MLSSQNNGENLQGGQRNDESLNDTITATNWGGEPRVGDLQLDEKNEKFKFPRGLLRR